ncbi:MAG TPA: glycosyltransferase family 2 protein [Desulfobacterales bacterium]|nr:glycosyltransferase family 2 protein [Desulfobacterales bacterium]
MKLIVQIPCLNEEHSLPQTVRDIPRRIDGIDEVEILIVDDGSTDRTIETARQIGVDHIVVHINNKGLAAAFRTGLDACLRLGADIIVNTDGDNQYKGQDIPKLVAPILAGRAEIVVGDRQTDNIPHFELHKKILQKFGSTIVRVLSGTDLPDAVSGFRAFSRDAAMQLNILTHYSYTVETILQAGKRTMAISSVHVGTNPKTRESRLIKSTPGFVVNQLNTMARMYAMHQPLRYFFVISVIIMLTGAVPMVRFFSFYFRGLGDGHIQSLILGSSLLVIGFQVLVLGFLGDVISFNRRLIEDTLNRVKKIEIDYLEKLKKSDSSSR